MSYGMAQCVVLDKVPYFVPFSGSVNVSKTIAGDTRFDSFSVVKDEPGPTHGGQIKDLRASRPIIFWVVR